MEGTGLLGWGGDEWAARLRGRQCLVATPDGEPPWLGTRARPGAQQQAERQGGGLITPPRTTTTTTAATATTTTITNRAAVACGRSQWCSMRSLAATSR